MRFACAKCWDYDCDCSYEDKVGKPHYVQNLPESYYKCKSPDGRTFSMGDIIVQENGNQWYIKGLDPVGRKAHVQLISPENYRELKIPYEELDGFKIIETASI